MDVTLETGPRKAAGEDFAKAIQAEAQYCIAGPRFSIIICPEARHGS